jgi:hypothetical protein
MRYMVKRVWLLSTHEVRLSVCMWGYAIGQCIGEVFNIYLLLWISSFVDTKVLSS